MKAKPNLNGNSPRDFAAAAFAMQAAADALSVALRAARTSVTHGRNYQHISNATDAATARAADDERLRHLDLAMNAALKLAEDIQRAAG